jgi:hypothetical protein
MLTLTLSKQLQKEYSCCVHASISVAVDVGVIALEMFRVFGWQGWELAIQPMRNLGIVSF